MAKFLVLARGGGPAPDRSPADIQLPATLGGLWQRAGDAARAARCYREARRLAGSAPERRFLTRRIAELTAVRRGDTSRLRTPSA